MRIIDADALKEDIMFYKTMPEIRKAICEVIDNAPTVEPKQGEWIPVSEKLPEVSRRYLVYTKYDEVMTDFFRVMSLWITGLCKVMMLSLGDHYPNHIRKEVRNEDMQLRYVKASL